MALGVAGRGEHTHPHVPDLEAVPLPHLARHLSLHASFRGFLSGWTSRDVVRRGCWVEGGGSDRGGAVALAPDDFDARHCSRAQDVSNPEDYAPLSTQEIPTRSRKWRQRVGTELLHVSIPPRVVPMRVGSEDVREREPLALCELEDSLRVRRVHAGLREVERFLEDGAGWLTARLPAFESNLGGSTLENRGGKYRCPVATV